MKGLINAGFEDFWQVYPRKTDRKKAEVAFNRLSDKDKFNAIQGAKYHRQQNPQWRNPKLIPHPTTFLNGARWADEVVIDIKDKIVEDQAKSPVDMVWSAMTQLYGNTWINKFGESPTEIWRKMLRNISVDRIKRGLKMTADNNLEFPPSLPTFISYCSRTFEEQYPPALPNTIKTDRTTALKNLALIQEAIKRSGSIDDVKQALLEHNKLIGKS